MRCTSCDYPLWNLKARQCPECGTAFVPSDFEFVLNSVRFCCPHCDQSYYGTGFKGHLVPDEFNCVQCGHRVSMNETVLRPALGVQEQQTQVGVMPWLQRKSIGFWKGWFKTIGEGMVRPNRLMRAVPVEGTGQAWLYALVTCLLVFTMGAGLPLLVIGVLILISGSGDAAEPLISAPISVLGTTLMLLLLVLMWGASAHGILRLTGGAAYPIGRTYQAMLYSMGSISPMALPCVGPYCGIYLLWIWYAVSAIFMVADGQRVHGGRATLAVLAFPVIGAMLAAVGYFALIFTLINTARAGGAFNPTAMSETTTMVQALSAYAQNNNGNLPAHALELVPANSFGVANFIATNSATSESDVPVADTSLDLLESLPRNKQRQAIQNESAKLPANVIAHRVGDFVFTYHGINLNSADPNLWIVMYSPDPDAIMAGSTPPRMTMVGTASGNVLPMPVNTPAMLQAQNLLRKQYALPPLPDPATVTHSKPAVSNQPPVPVDELSD